MDLNKDDDNIVLDESIDLNEMEDISFGTLSLEDWITIENVRSSFLSVFQNDIPLRFCADMSDRDTALISWSQFANKISLRCINYFRHMDEFENLNADDRFILVKYNLLPLYPLMKCFNDKRIDDTCLCDDNEEAERHRQFFILCGDSYGIRDIFFNLVLSLVEITEQDSTVLSLLTMVWIFTHGLSMNDNEATLKDAVAVQRAQSHYTKLLWNYWVNKQGEIQACKYFTQLLTIIFRIQSGSKIFRDFFRTQFLTSNTVDRMAPLMQSVLHIS
jgi:hypothetical protein